VAIINNDAVASQNWIEAMVKTAESDEQLGSVATVVLNGHNPKVLDSFGVGVALDGMSRQVNHNRPPPDVTGPQDTLLVSGCACMFRMTALKETGLFDESFFAYCEDTDLGLRLRWAGYRCVVVPEASVLHYYSMTTEKFSIDKVFWVERNHYWVAAKNFPITLLLLVPFFTACRVMLQVIILLKGSSELDGFTKNTRMTQLIWTIIKANIAAICGTPTMLRARYGYPKRVSQVWMIRTLIKYRLSIYQVLTGT
jgi:GT2 family glycosyltransferase